MKMKTVFQIIFALILMSIVSYAFGAIDTGGLMLGVIVSGPLRDFKWAGISLAPTKDSEFEYNESGYNYEINVSPNGTDYASAESVAGYVQQEIALSPSEYNEVKQKQDGAFRTGTATLPDGSVVSINGAIDGEFINTNGKVQFKITGKVKLQ